MPVLKQGDTFAKYHILSYLGGGAYGEVYRVTETGGDDTLAVAVDFALKLPKDSTIAREVLMKEARVWSACSQHPNIARLVKAGFEGEQFYMLSEYISSGSLRGKIGLNKGRPEVTQLWAVELVCGILRAVIHLHTPRKIAGYDSNQQVLHRDLKPENILLDGDVPKVTDFGVSRAFRSSEGVMSSGGTLYYNSPESFQGGMTSGNDVWSCAVILYELLSGHLPFHGEHQAQVMHSIMLSPLRMLPSCVPVELGRIVLRALEKSPEKRYASANEFLRELEEVRDQLAPKFRLNPVCLAGRQDCCLLKAVEPLETPVVARKAPPVEVKEARPVLATPHVAKVPKGNSVMVETPIKPKSPVVPPIPLVRATGDTQTATAEKSSSKILVGMAVLLALLVVVFGLSRLGGEPSSQSAPAITPPTNIALSLPEMVRIPGGTFQMGGDANNEKPIHTVTLASFSMSKYEVTVGQYESYCKDAGKPMPDAPDFNANWRNKNHPMVNVSWEEAMAYCKWLSKKTGKSYDLPTEAEWEYASRGGLEGKKYPWGDDFDRSLLRCSENKAGDSGGTIAVGSYPANGYGLHDMSGNVWEWCKDWYGEDYYKSSPSANPQGPTTGDSRVLRGGGWFLNYPDIFRCAVRYGVIPAGRINDFGFRPVFH